MAGAILRGAVKSSVLDAAQIHVYDVNLEKARALQGELGVCAHEDCAEMIAACDAVLIAVKPNVVAKVLEGHRGALAGKALISIAAGWSTQMLRDALSADTRVLRVMPNTPALVGEGMTALCSETTLTAEELRTAQGIFDALGKTVLLPERMFDGVIAVSGSSPAYVYMLIEAMADAGVREGLTWKDACRMAAQSVFGSALMVLSTGEHPAKLRNDVCSPAGTTIDAVAALEQGGFRSAVMEAMRVCADKSREMGRKSKRH